MRQLAEAHDVDLARSFAYSDSATDLPMLEAVGHPVAVNPDRTLRRIAAARDWEILRFGRPTGASAQAEPAAVRSVRTERKRKRPGAAAAAAVAALAAAIAGGAGAVAWRSRSQPGPA
jgi:hypothetical protein